MDILTRIESALTQALKAKDEITALTLRQLKTALTNAEIANNRQALADEQVIKILRSEVKKRKEAADLYASGGRNELVEKERQEIDIISHYLPAELSEQDVAAKVTEVIAKLGASGPQDMGKVMGAVMKELGTAADGNVVSAIVKQQLVK